MYLHNPETWSFIFPRMARRRKPAKKRRGKGPTDSASSQPTSSLEQVEADLSLHAAGEADAWSSSLGPPQDSGSETVRRRRRSRKGTGEEEDGEEAEGLLRQIGRASCRERV